MSTVNLAEPVKEYIELRDKRDAVKKKVREILASIEQRMDELEAMFLDQLQQSGMESVRTAAGTVFLSTKSAATVKDWDAVVAFIAETGLQALYEKRVNKSIVEEVIQETGAPPPGVQYTRTVEPRVHRAA